MRFWELGKRNFKEMWRDPLSLGILLGIPIILMLMLGFVWRETTITSPVGIINQDKSPISREFGQVLEDLPSFDIRHYDDIAQAKDDLKFGDIKAFVTIPEGFGEQVRENWQGTRENINLSISYDQTNPVLAQQIVAIIKEVTAVFSRAKPLLIITEETIQPKSGSFNWLAPGMAIFGLLMLIMVSASKMASDKEKGFLSRLLTTPLKPWGFVLGYALPFILISLFQAIIYIAVAIPMGLKIYGSPPLILLIFLIHGISCVGIGMIVGSLAKSEGQASMIGTFIWIPLSFLANVWFSLEMMPSYWTSIAYALPFAHAADAARAILTKGVEFGVIATDFYWLIGWTVALFAIGIVLFRRSMTR